jgi:hypothetical protein
MNWSPGESSIFLNWSGFGFVSTEFETRMICQASKWQAICALCDE